MALRARNNSVPVLFATSRPTIANRSRDRRDTMPQFIIRIGTLSRLMHWRSNTRIGRGAYCCRCGLRMKSDDDQVPSSAADFFLLAQLAAAQARETRHPKTVRVLTRMARSYLERAKAL